jgi:hypothetical protein
MPFGFWWPQGPQEPLIRACEVSIDLPFHGGSNDTIGSRVQPQWPEILLSFHGSILILALQFRNFAGRTNLCRHSSLSLVKNLLVVLLTLVNSLLPVLLTPVIKLFPIVIDTGQKQPKSLKFIAGVNDTAEKLFTGVVDTADKFFASVDDICLDLKMKNKQKFNLQV